MKTKAYFCFLVAVVATPFKISAQVDINSDNFSYQQDFNVLGTSASPWSDNTTIPNWYAANSNGTVLDYRVDNTGTAGLYSYGTDADRALGSLAANSTGDIIYGVLFQNNTGQTINSIELSFNAEHWRRPQTDVIGHQRMKVSYLIDNGIDVSDPALYNNPSFIDLPEAYLVTLDTIRTSTITLNGNTYSALISVSLPVSIANGSQFFLRFKDENIADFDASLAVDDLQVIFRWSTAPRIQATSGYNIFQYLDMGIVMDIPNGDNSPPYTAPSPAQMNDWQQILESFYDDHDLDDVNASAYGYEAVEFLDLMGTTYHVLRKQNYSTFYWGTYVKLVNAANNTLVIQSPHASDDLNTGTQGAAIFYRTESKCLMLSGTSRCAGDPNIAACHGTTTTCSNNNTELPFLESDVAHATNSIFHLATIVYAGLNPTAVFAQLHGFGQDNNDPDLIISCGMVNANFKSVPDYPVMVRESLLDLNASLDIKLSHVDDFAERPGETNVQGRYLNLYPHDICADGDAPQTVTNRFLHVEQYLAFRTFPNHYATLATALSTAINDNAYIKSISIDSNPFFYSEDFTGLTYPGISHTWGNNVHLPGWYAAGTQDVLFSVFHIARGQLNNGGIYSFGPDGSDDRAFGSISTSPASSAGDVAYGVLFKNNTGVTLFGAELEYDSEQWRDSNIAGIQTVEFSYKVADEIELHPNALLDNTLYTFDSNGDLNSSNANGGSNALDGNANANHITFTASFILNPEQEIFFRFYDADNTGFDKAMAVDNFNVHFLTEPPMPVEWKYFEISGKNGKPILQWGADKEDKCNRYEILRSDDGKDYKSIAIIPCKRKLLNNHYEYIDYGSIWERNIYYRIVQYDENGDATHSQLKVFNATPSAKPLVYFRNGELYIEANGESTLLSVGAFDFMGRQLCQEMPSKVNNTTYNLSCPVAANQLIVVQLIFDSGNYVERLRTGN